MQIKIRKIVAVILLCAGICLVSYPWISNWIYGQMVQSEVETYERTITQTDESKVKQQWEQAEAYNERLTVPFVSCKKSPGEPLCALYPKTLCITDDGLMCFIEIPKINVFLPVYHGTSAEVLEKGAGHLQGTALPVGGTGHRPVISAHSGISSSKMFSDLENIENGDYFFIHVLDQTLCYKVCKTELVLPEETDKLAPEEGRDLVSLLTCAPYGVNTHRLIVTGERCEDRAGTGENSGDSTVKMMETGWMKNYRYALEIGLVIIAGTTVYRFFKLRIRKNGRTGRSGRN